jgi:hypothetical protein
MSLISATIWNANGTITFIATTSQTISTNGVFITAGIVFNGIGGTWTLGSALSTSGTTLTAGTLNLNNFTLTTGIFSSNNSNTRSISFGTGDIILTSGTADTTVLIMATATGFTWTGTGGFTSIMNTTRVFTFGTTSGGTATNAPNLTLSSGASVATLTTGSYFNKLDFSTTTFIIQPTTLNLNALTLSSGGSFSGITANMVGTGSINPNGNTVNSVGVLVINNGAGTTTLAAALSCNTFTMTSGTINFATFNLTCSSTATYTAGTLNNIGTISCTTFTVNTGTFTLTQGTITPSTSFVVSGNGTFNYNGGTLTTPLFTHTSGNVTLGQAYSVATAGASTYTLTAGTLNLATFTLTTGIFSSTGTGTRSVAFGTGNIVLSNTVAATTVLSMADARNFTCTGIGGFQTSAAITRTLTFGSSLGGSATNAPNLTLTGSGTAIATLTTGSWFNTLSFGATAFNPGTTTLNLNGLTLSSGVGAVYTTMTVNMVGTGTITSNGNTTLAILTINSTSGTTTLGGNLALTATGTTTLTSGTLALGTFTLTTGIFSSNNSNTRSISFGANDIILAHTTAATTVLSMATATGFTWSGTGGFTSTMSITRTFNVGSTAGSASAAPNLSLTSGASVPTFTDGSWFKTLDFTGTTCTPALTANALGINIDTLTLATGGTYTGFIPVFTRTQTWTPQFSKQLGGIGCNIPGGTFTLENTQTYTATSVTILTAGTLNLGGYDLTTGIFSSSNTNTRSIAFGTNNIILAHTTAATTVLSMSTTTGFTWSGTGGFTAAANITRTFTFAVPSFLFTATNAAPNLTITGSGTAIQTFTTGSQFNTLNFTSTAFAVPSTTLYLTSLTLSTGGTFSSMSCIMVGTGTITPNNNTTLSNLSIGYASNATLGTTTLGGPLTVGGITHNGGTLDLGGFTLTTRGFQSIQSYPKSIVFGTSNIVLTPQFNGSTPLQITNVGPNYTYTGTGGFQSNASFTCTYIVGGGAGNFATTPPAPNLFITSGSATPTIQSGSWFNTLNFTGSTCSPVSNSSGYGIYVDTLILATGGTYTGFGFAPVFTRTQTWTSQFSKQLGGIGVGAPGITLTLDGTQTFATTSFLYPVGGTLDLGGYDLTIGQVYTGVSAVQGARSIAFGSNNILIREILFFDTTNITFTGTGGFLADSSAANTFGFTATSTINSPNLTFTGSGTATQTFNSAWFNTVNFGSSLVNTSGTVYPASLTLSASGNFSGLTVRMSGTGTITSNGNTTLGSLFINHTGTTTLGAALTLAATTTTTLTSGTLALGTFTLTTGIFSSTNTNTRSISFGTGNIVLAHTTAAQTVLAMDTATGFTCTATTGGFTSTMSVTRTFVFGTTGGSATNAPNLTLSSGSSIATLTTGSWFNTLNFGTTTFNPGTTTLNLNGFTLSATGTYTTLTPTMVGTGTITSNGNTTLAILTINNFGSSGVTTLGNDFTLAATGTTTLTSGVLALGGHDLTTGIFSSSNSNVRYIDFGSNYIVLAHTTAGTTVLAMSNITNFNCIANNDIAGFSASAAITRTYTMGVTGTTLTNQASLKLTGNGTAVQTFTTGSYFWTLDFGTTAFAVPTTTLNFLSLILSNGGTFTGLTANNTWATGVSGPATIRSNGNTTLLALTINVGITLLDTLTLTPTGTVTLPAATTLTLNGFNLTTGIFISTGSATVNFGSNNIVLAHPTAAQTVLSIASAINWSWTGTGGFQTDAAVTRTLTFGSSGVTSTSAPNLTLTGSGTAVVTLTTNSWFKNLNFGTTAFTLGTRTLNLTSLTLSSAALAVYTGLTATMRGTGTITSNGKTIAALTINNPGTQSTSITGSDTVTLNDPLTLVATGTTTLTAGILNLNGFDLITGIFSSSSLVLFRQVQFGTGNIVLSHTTAATTVLVMANPGGFSYTGTGGFTSTMSVTRTFTFGTTGIYTTNAPNLTLSSGASVATITTGSYFKTLNFGTTAFTIAATTLNLNSLTLSSQALAVYTNLTINMFGTGTITPNGKTIGTLNIGVDGIGSDGQATTTAAGAVSCTTFTIVNSAILSYSIDFATFSLTCTNSLTGDTNLFGPAGTLNLNNITCTTYTVNGTVTLAVGQSLNATTSIVTATAFTINGTLTTALFTHTSGTVTLGASVTLAATGTYTLTAGALNLANFTLTTGIFSSSNTNTRSIAFGTASITLNTSVAASTVLSMATVTGFTYTGTGNFISDAAVTRTFTFGTTGGSITNSPNLAINGSGTAIATITTGSWFNTLSFDTTAFVLPTTSLNLKSLTLSSGGTFTGLTITVQDTGTITGNSRTIVSMTINHTGTTTIAGTLLTCTGSITLTAGILTLAANLNLTTTNGQFSSSNANTRSINFGTYNIELQNSSAATVVLNMSNATNFTVSGTGGFTSSNLNNSRTLTFGNTAGASAANSPNLTFATGAASATLTTGSYFNKLDFGTTTFTLAATSLNLNSLTLSATGTYTSLTATMVGTGAIIANGKSITSLTINHSGITQLGSALTTTASVTLTAGTLALAGFTLTSVNFISGTAATRSISGAGTGIISLSGNWTVTDGTGWTRFSTGNGYKINMTSASSKTFTGANGSYGTLVQAGAGAMTISGSNVFADIQATTRPSTITFTAGTTQTLEAFTLAGTAGNLVTIGSTVPDSAFTLSNAISTSTANYLSIRDCYVTGGAPWYNNNGTNTRLTNNSNWNTAAAAMSLFF